MLSVGDSIFTLTLEEETWAEPLDTETAPTEHEEEEEEVASGQLSNSKTKIEANDSELDINGIGETCRA